MTQFLPPNLLALFAPRDPIPFLPPTDKLKRKKAVQPYSGVSQYLNLFEDPSETPAPTFGETREEKEERKKRERLERVERDVEEKMAEWDPNTDPNASTDPFKTLFVARINYDTSESKLRRELESYGPVRRIKMVVNTKTGKSRGYAFVEFESERDMHAAYKHADGKKIDGRRILVDVERGRTVKSWRPRRLGGGLGGTRRGGPDVNIRHSGRVDNYDAGRERERERERDRERERPRERRRSRSRERERERPRERERDIRRDRDRERERDRDRERDRERDRDRDRRRDRDRERPDRDRDREKDKREKDRDRDRDRDRRRDRDRDRDRDRGEKDRDRERERGERDRDRDRERDRAERDEEDRDERGSRDDDRRHYDSASYEEDGQIDVKQELEDGEENPYESKGDYGYDRGYNDPSEELRTKVKTERNYAQYQDDSYNGEADADMD